MVALQAGVSRLDAAREAGISPRTIDRWVERGRRDPDSIYGRFAAEVDRLLEARKVPLPDKPISDREVQLCLSRAIRAGNVQAMRIWLDTYGKGRAAGRTGDADKGPTGVDELAARRLEQQAGTP